MRKLAITVGLLCLVTITSVGAKNQQAISSLLHCHTFAIDSTCLMNSVNLEIHHNPDKSAATLKQIATLRRAGLVGGDFRAYSLTLHHLGSMYFMNGVPFETLNQRCPKLVKDGCVHGYVMNISRPMDHKKHKPYVRPVRKLGFASAAFMRLDTAMPKIHQILY